MDIKCSSNFRKLNRKPRRDNHFLSSELSHLKAITKSFNLALIWKHYLQLEPSIYILGNINTKTVVPLLKIIFFTTFCCPSGR